MTSDREADRIVVLQFPRKRPNHEGATDVGGSVNLKLITGGKTAADFYITSGIETHPYR